MGPLKLGTMLSRKYRIDRLLRDEYGVVSYEATDTVHACLVGIKIIRREALTDDLAFDRFKLEAWEPSAIDFGSVMGLPYFVTTEWERCGPPPLPPPRPRAPTIPIFFEEEPAPDSPPRHAHAWPWVAMLLVACLTGAGGWYAGHAHASHATHVTAGR